MSFLTRLRDNLIGWPALERSPLGVLQPTTGLDDFLTRWKASFFEGVHESSPPGTQTPSAQTEPDLGGVGSPPDADIPSGGEPQPTEDEWEDDGLDDERRQTREAVWARRIDDQSAIHKAVYGIGANLKVDKFGDVYEDPAIPPDKDPHLTIAEVYVHIDDLSEQVHDVVHENRRLKSELNQALAQLRIARGLRDQYQTQLNRLQQNR